MKKTALLGAIALASVSLAACATAPNGDRTIFGQDIGSKNSALVAKYNTDLQNFVASLPNACSQAASTQGFTSQTLSVAQSIFTTLKPSTVSQLNTIAADIVTACKGLQVASVPAAVAVAAASQ